ncbi:glycosyltransferase family 32 protein [Cytidiella melzeri]|nr:glycosyltransferase family 32 protein [Cytidiella melzeri]
MLYYLWQPHVEFSVYSRSWIRDEVEALHPLSGCFNEHRISHKYNATQALYGAKKTEIHSGMPMRLGMDCYNFAGTIKSVHETPHSWIPPQERTQYHTYWRSDLADFGERQEWMIKSFFATQNLDTSRLILWSNGDLGQNKIVQKWIRRYPDSFTLKLVNLDVLAKGTSLQESKLLRVKDKKAWIDGDLVRLLVLWAYGGVWVDMDSLLTRDLAPLLEHEFVTQWDCYDKIYIPFNGALMNFHQHSPYLCEAFHIMSTGPSPRTGTTDWGATLYLKLWRRLLEAAIPPFKVLPFCFSDGRSCRLDNRLPDPFVTDPKNKKWTMGMGREEGGGLDHVLGKIFSVHLHNQWEKQFPKGGWIERLLLRRYDDKLKRIKPRTLDEDT